MKRIVALFAIAAFSSALFGQDQSPLRIMVPEGTQIRARLASQLDSGQVRIGDLVTMDVLEDIEIQNAVVIPHGSIVMGHVAAAKGARKMGRGGKLEISFETVTAGDGTKVPVNGDRSENGKGGYGGGSLAGAGAAGLFFPPAAALLLLKHGHTSVIPVGTILTVRVAADTTVAGIPVRTPPVAALSSQPSSAPVPSTQRHLVVISGAGAAELKPGDQSESLGDAARRIRAEKAAKLAQQQAAK